MNEQTKNTINAFVKTLREMFMVDDAAELDFGIYRIMAQKKAEIETFFGLNDESEENALCRKIEALLAEQQGASVNVAEIKKKMEDRIRVYKEDGETMDDIYKKKSIIELRQQLEETGDPTVMLPHILTALNDFFSRYYDKGDFISQRRYVNGGDATYLVPYNGEEVKLHWANADQYYIKTSEAFKNYRFKLKNGKEVEFTLKNAVQLKNNEKEQKDWARKFKLWDGVSEPGEEPEPDFVPVQIEEDGVLHIYFTYELMKKKGNEQNTLNKAIYAKLAAIILTNYKDDYLDLITNTSGKDTEELRRHINRYTTKNSSDYFIHKNLGDFLRRELDFYLKNEIMHVSDLDYNNLRRTLAEAKTIKAVGEEIIQMLAGLEDFQKKLWLKNKFVVQSDYCITLDRVPESLYEEICANEEQHEEWKRLFDIESIKATEGDMFSSGKQGYTGELTVQFLKENPHLVLDTAFFNNDFKHRLLESMENIDAQCDGLLVNSENFQALELLQEKYQEQVCGVYLDPPYNTKKNEFIYKDSFKHSSWMSMMQDRLLKIAPLMKRTAPILISCDENEQSNLHQLGCNVFGDDNFLTDIIWEGSSKNDQKYMSISHEYIEVFMRDKLFMDGTDIRWMERKEGLDRIYAAYDKIAKQYPSNYEAQSKAMKQWFNDLPKSDPARRQKHYCECEKRGLYFADNISKPANGYFYDVLHPVTGKPCKKPKGGWRFIETTMKEQIADDRVVFGKDEKTVPCRKSFLRETEYESPSTVTYLDNRVSTALIKDLFGDKNKFDNPKYYLLIARFLKLVGESNGIFMDMFGGSGTTAHSVIYLNREDKGSRRYVLGEMGEYFESVTKPRIQKVIYSKDWKDGKPVSREGSSHCFKYIRLEQYEDTLNNLYRTPMEGAWYEEELGADTIGYVMDMQSQQNWMHTDWMANPFGVKMQIAHGNETTEQTIDVVETFNYLLGMNVKKMLWPAEGMQVVIGTTRRGKRTMIIWRNTAHVTDEEVKTFLSSVDHKPFKQIYINGETTLGTILDGKLRQTETEFEYRMFPNE